MADAEPRVLPLPEALDVAAAAALADSLRDARGAPIALAAGKVRKVGAQCVQVLLAAAVAWRADRVPLRLDAPTPELLEALRLMGLSARDITAGETRA